MSSASGDFPLVLRDVLTFKGYTTTNGEYTVKDANNALDSLRGNSDNQNIKTVLAEMLTKLGANEIYWMARIILKEMKMGLRHEAVLRAFHPDADDHYNTYTDLRRLCSELSNPEIRVVPKIELFVPFTPMLAHSTHIQKKVAQKMGEFIIEEKYDGERALVHYDATTGQVC